MATSRSSTEIPAAAAAGGATSFSHFERTVCLFDWWLIHTQNHFHGNNLGVAGLTSRQQEAVRVFTSAPIAKRYDVFTLETTDNVCISLKGVINQHRTTLNGFPSQVSRSFLFGFPSNWRQFSTYAPPDFQEKTPEKQGCVTSKHRKQVETSESHKVSENGILNTESPAIFGKCGVVSGPETSTLQEKTLEKQGCVTLKHGKHVETSESHKVSENGNTLNNSKVSNLSDEKKHQLDVTPIGFRKCSARLRNLRDRPIGFQKCSDRLKNLKGSQRNSLPSGCSLDQEQQNVSPVQMLDDEKLNSSIAATIHSTDRVPEISYVGSKRKQKPVDTNVTVKLGDESLSIGLEQTSNSKRGHDSGNAETKARQETGFKEGRKDTKTRKRKNFSDTAATPPLRDNKIKVSVVSPDCLSYGRSRSGRLLLPVMEFWRNQMPVYDVDRKLTGIQESIPVVVPSRGTQSEPPKKRNR
ncbi:hypothetical protein CsatB_004543 [Cannabis sativa]